MHDGVSGSTGRVEIPLNSKQLLDRLTSLSKLNSCNNCSTGVEVRGDSGSCSSPDEECESIIGRIGH